MTPIDLAQRQLRASNRIQIVNWRQHNDYESYVRVEAFGGDEPELDLADIIMKEEGLRPCAEDDEEWDKIMYVNDDTEIADGEVFVNKATGRTFLVSIREVKMEKEA